MNDLEKRSYYSFVILYLVSTFILLSVSAFWYYTAQKQSQQSMLFYEMQHKADLINSAIIQSHMQGVALYYPPMEAHFNITLLNENEVPMLDTSLALPSLDTSKDFYQDNGQFILVSQGANLHLGVKYVVVNAPMDNAKINQLKIEVLSLLFSSFVIVALIGFFLSRLFLQPIHKKMDEIEHFIKDITHELITPITALKMSTKRALKQHEFSERSMRNISISTKQLYDIYTSLTYLNFTTAKSDDKVVDLSSLLRQSVEYFSELSSSKNIAIDCKSDRCQFSMDEDKARMLFNNLISNAIKYSPPDSRIEIRLKDGHFSIVDQGIGIAEEAREKIFERFSRATEYAGGFGIGLDIVRNIANEYNIGLDIYSELNKGTEFKLSFKCLNLSKEKSFLGETQT